MNNLQQSRTGAASLSPSPIVEINGQLKYKSDCMTPEYFARSPFTIELYGDRVRVDHFVLMLPDANSAIQYGDRLVELGAAIAEGPGEWPNEFCPDDEPFPDDLAMYFISLLLPSGGILVLLAPHAPHDRLDRDRRASGDNAVPHIAIQVNDMHSAAQHWRQKGFIPLSAQPQDDGCLCQWFLRNWAGQVIELIRRQPGGQDTFSCQNIRGLRLSEVEQ